MPSPVFQPTRSAAELGGRQIPAQTPGADVRESRFPPAAIPRRRQQPSLVMQQAAQSTGQTARPDADLAMAPAPIAGHPMLSTASMPVRRGLRGKARAPYADL